MAAAGCRRPVRQKRCLPPPFWGDRWLEGQGEGGQPAGQAARHPSGWCRAHHSPLKLDQSEEKSEVPRGPNSGLATCSICSEDPMGHQAARDGPTHPVGLRQKVGGAQTECILTRGRPRPARAQLTVASFSLSAEATGPARLAGGKMGPLQLGHW